MHFIANCLYAGWSFPISAADSLTVKLALSFFNRALCYTYVIRTLTEVFPCFSSVVRQMPGYNS